MKRFVKKFAAVLAVVVLLAAVMAPAASALDMLGTFSELLGSDFGDILGEILGGGGNVSGNATGYSLDDLLNNRGGLMDALRERLANTSGISTLTNEDVQKALSAILTDDIVIDLSDNELLVKLAEYLQNMPSTEPLPTNAPVQNPTGNDPSTTPTNVGPNGEILPGGDAGTTAAIQPSFTYEVPSYVIPDTSYVYSSTQPYVTDNQYTPSYTYNDAQPSSDYAGLQTGVPYNASVQEGSTQLKTQTSNNKLIIGVGLLGVSAVAIAIVLVKMKKAQA